MQTSDVKCYLKKVSVTRATIETELLGADTELSPEIIDFLGASSLVSKVAVKPVELDEYELAMAGVYRV